MKKLVILFASLFILVIAAKNVNAQDGNSATANTKATAKIIAPITISLENDGLNFGTLVRTGKSGTVVITPEGARNNYDIDLINQEDEFSAALYNVSGEKDYTFSITLPSSVSIKSGTTNSMEVNTFTSSIPKTGNTLGNNATSFAVGATINVSATQAAGEYEGSFDVTVAYE